VVLTTESVETAGVSTYNWMLRISMLCRQASLPDGSYITFVRCRAETPDTTLMTNPPASEN